MTINSSTIIVARMYGMRAIPPPGFNNSWTNDILLSMFKDDCWKVALKKAGSMIGRREKKEAREGTLVDLATQPCSKFKGF